MKTVRIYISNGVVSSWAIPPGITVIIRDYDCPEDCTNVEVDEDGDHYQEIILEGAG